jgi:4-hydroxy-tetrahydrodipicolinate synthase
MKFGRLLTAMVTPFDDAGKVDYRQAKKLALALVKSGTDSLVISGTTGESPTLTRAEKLKLFEEIKSAVGAKVGVIAGTGTYSTSESVELTREAEKAGADGILAVVPYYNRPSQDGLFLHFKAIAEATRLPCMLYNVPSRTVAGLTSDTVIKLGQVENIFAIKEASGNLDQIAKIIEGARKDFIVYSGNDSDILPILALGGYGVVSVASHLVGEQIQGMMADFNAGRTKQAASTHRRLLPLVNALFLVANPMPVKYALNQVGFKVGKPRLPLTEPDEKTALQIKAALAKHKIDLPVYK